MKVSTWIQHRDLFDAKYLIKLSTSLQATLRVARTSMGDKNSPATYAGKQGLPGPSAQGCEFKQCLAGTQAPGAQGSPGRAMEQAHLYTQAAGSLGSISLWRLSTDPASHHQPQLGRRVHPKPPSECEVWANLTSLSTF